WAGWSWQALPHQGGDLAQTEHLLAGQVAREVLQLAVRGDVEGRRPQRLGHAPDELGGPLGRLDGRAPAVQAAGQDADLPVLAQGLQVRLDEVDPDGVDGQPPEAIRVWPGVAEVRVQ